MYICTSVHIQLHGREMPEDQMPLDTESQMCVNLIFWNFWILFRALTIVIFYTEPVIVNIYGAQESIPPGWESIPGLLKGSTNTGQAVTHPACKEN